MKSAKPRDKIDGYLRSTFYKIPGYMPRLDAVVFRDIIAGQSENNITGALAEIGVHWGRSFFVLVQGRSGTEKILGMDLFERDDGTDRLDLFVSNCKKYRLHLPDDAVMKANSLELRPDDITGRVGRVRFFHIDGGHMHEAVTNDLLLAESVLTDRGVISVDDILNPLWPEIAIATFDWLRRKGNRLAPFLLTKDKLYLCYSKDAPFYMAMINGDKSLAGRIVRVISVLNHEVAVLLPSTADRITDRLGGWGLSFH